MMVCEDRKATVRTGRISLILPLVPAGAVPGRKVAEYREVLEEKGNFESVEVIVARGTEQAPSHGVPGDSRPEDGLDDFATHVVAEGREWSALVRAGLRASTGDHLVVLDLRRHYSPESLTQVIAPVRTGEFDLAVAVSRHGRSRLARWSGSSFSFGLISRLFLGTSDVFSGLFALERSVWDRDRKDGAANASSLVLDSLLRRPSRCIDVPVAVDDRFRTRRVGLEDLRPLKHLIDGRFGNYSRLVQFCMVGASGMIVDLAFYALLQWLLSFTWLATRQSAFFSCSWHLAVAAALSITIALVWNFTLNRRLTFNDARKGSVFRQFFTYALSNALAIALSFSVRLYLPSRVAFFARHRLAAAVVGIVAATGISFSMARWFVFARRPDQNRPVHFPREQPVSQHTHLS
ncbi:MAG: GtrA family protein [Isosphaerales bacterium]